MGELLHVLGSLLTKQCYIKAFVRIFTSNSKFFQKKTHINFTRILPVWNESAQCDMCCNSDLLVPQTDACNTSLYVVCAWCAISRKSAIVSTRIMAHLRIGAHIMRTYCKTTCILEHISTIQHHTRVTKIPTVHPTCLWSYSNFIDRRVS